MISMWFELKEKAVGLRKTGLSIKKIENELGIPRSTLSGWFRYVELSESQKEKLRRDWRNGLITARQKAAIWHKNRKEERIACAKKEALETLSRIDNKDHALLELALSILYLGEGSKKQLALLWEVLIL